MVCLYRTFLACRDSKGKATATLADGLQLPDVATVLPLQSALQGLNSYPPAVVKAVYLHWCHKRQYTERPLLQRLWYEPPWHRLTVAGDFQPVLVSILKLVVQKPSSVEQQLRQ